MQDWAVSLVIIYLLTKTIGVPLFWVVRRRLRMTISNVIGASAIVGLMGVMVL